MYNETPLTDLTFWPNFSFPWRCQCNIKCYIISYTFLAAQWACGRTVAPWTYEHVRRMDRTPFWKISGLPLAKGYLVSRLRKVIWSIAPARPPEGLERSTWGQGNIRPRRGYLVEQGKIWFKSRGAERIFFFYKKNQIGHHNFFF